MASGALLVLVGEECKRQREYTKLDKEYVMEVLLGARTDTGDILGIPELSPSLPNLSLLPAALRKERGTHTRTYPQFSSKTVQGKPLFMYALEGTLDAITIPSHEETIYRIEHCATRAVTARDLHAEIEGILSITPTSDEPSKALGADFRIGTIRPRWQELLMASDRTFTVLTLRVTCASGTYMRSLAERIGEQLGTYGSALSIRRTRIGRYARFLGLWTRTFR